MFLLSVRVNYCGACQLDHRLRGSASPVLTATGFVNVKGQFSTPTESITVINDDDDDDDDNLRVTIQMHALDLHIHFGHQLTLGYRSYFFCKGTCRKVLSTAVLSTRMIRSFRVWF